jgi:hypothetical protein
VNVRRVEAQRKAALSRAVPYLGIACLALLALAGARALPAELAALTGSGPGPAPASWLAGSTVSQSALGTMRSTGRSAFSSADLHAPAISVGTLAAHLRLVALATTVAPLGLGALVLAVLLVAIALAICH